MTPIAYTAIFAAGTAAGSLVGWLVARAALVNRYSSALMEKREALATLTETVRSQSEEIQGLRWKVEADAQEKKTLSVDLLNLSTAREAAMARLENMASLEAALKESKTGLAEKDGLIVELKKQQATLETIIEKERAAANEKVALLTDIRGDMTNAHEALSARALKENNRLFLDLARSVLSKYLDASRDDLNARSLAVKNMVAPVREALDRYDRHIQDMERSREKAYGGLSQQVRSLLSAQNDLQAETGKLARALRVPHVRGRWGEMTLRRVAELSGMQNHCDFTEQPSANSPEGLFRPDMIVYLPGGRCIIVDAKVPLAAYLEALEVDTEAGRQEKMAGHAKQVQTHITRLAQKSYWKQFQPAPEFVIMFIPGENFFSAALALNPELIELGAAKGVILATPTTLISLLKTVSLAWRHHTAAENARTISELGNDLYERLNTLAAHMDRLGRDIERCAGTYNQVIGTFEGRVLATARKFHRLGVTPEGEEKLNKIAPAETRKRKVGSELP